MLRGLGIRSWRFPWVDFGPFAGYLLLEDGFFLLQEDGDRLDLE